MPVSDARHAHAVNTTSINPSLEFSFLPVTASSTPAVTNNAPRIDYGNALSIEKSDDPASKPTTNLNAPK